MHLAVESGVNNEAPGNETANAKVLLRQFEEMQALPISTTSSLGEQCGAALGQRAARLVRGAPRSWASSALFRRALPNRTRGADVSSDWRRRRRRSRLALNGARKGKPQSSLPPLRRVPSTMLETHSVDLAWWSSRALICPAVFIGTNWPRFGGAFHSRASPLVGWETARPRPQSMLVWQLRPSARITQAGKGRGVIPRYPCAPSPRGWRRQLTARKSVLPLAPSRRAFSCRCALCQDGEHNRTSSASGGACR
jgi:hypothetical protein